MLPRSFAVALSWAYLQLAMSPAPTSVTVVCAAPGTAASTAATHARRTAKAIDAIRGAVFVMPVPLLPGGALRAPPPTANPDCSLLRTRAAGSSRLRRRLYRCSREDESSAD